MARHKRERNFADILHELRLEARYWSHRWHDSGKYQARRFFLKGRHPQRRLEHVITRGVGLFGNRGAK